MAEKRSPRGTTLFLAWTVATLLLTLLFVRDHPPRPLFQTPVPGEGGGFPIASHAAAVGGALLYSLFLLVSGTGAARCLRLRRLPVVALFGLGALYAVLLIFLLLSLGLFRLPIACPLLLLPLLFRIGERVEIRWPRWRVPPLSRGEWVLAAILTAAACGVLIRTLAPPTANNPSVYHTPLALGYAGSGGFGGAPDLVYARMPHAGDLLFAGAALFGGEGAARLFHLFLLLAAASGAALLARRWSKGGAGLAAAALFGTLPLVLDRRTVGNVDLVAALWFGLSLYLIDRGRMEGKRAPIVGAALLAGGMLSVKYSTYAAYPLLLAPLLLPVLGGRTLADRRTSLLLFLGLSHALLLPWLGKAWIETGNPLFPMFPGPLGGEGWDPVLSERLWSWQRSIGPGRDLLRTLILPWNVIMEGAPNYRGFDGVLSPALLLWGFWAAVRGGRTTGALLLLVVAGIYLWGFGSQQLRFLLPVVLLAASIAGAYWKTEPGTRGSVQGVLFAGILLLGTLPFLRNTLADTLPVVIGRETREAYLDRQVQPYRAWRALPEIVPAGEKVFLLWENRVLYATRPWEADSFFEASEAMRRAEKAGSGAALLRSLREEGVRWLLVNHKLGGIFAGWASKPALARWQEVIAASEPAGEWHGLALYRLPSARGFEDR